MKRALENGLRLEVPVPCLFSCKNISSEAQKGAFLCWIVLCRLYDFHSHIAIINGKDLAEFALNAPDGEFTRKPQQGTTSIVPCSFQVAGSSAHSTVKRCMA